MKSVVKHLVRVGLVTAAVLVGVLAFQGMHAPAAHASGSSPQCYKSSCNNMDPTTTYGPNSSTLCKNDAYLQGTRQNYSWGWIENWWSANCDANWTVGSSSSGYDIVNAEADACSSGTGTLGGFPTCSGTMTMVCDYYTYIIGGRNLYDACGGSSYNVNDMPWGTTHWYTNMVRGDQPTFSVMEVTTCAGCQIQVMDSGWH